PIKALEDPRSRDEFLKWRDHIGKTSPRQADFAWSTIKLILTWALDRGLVTANPCERGGRLYDADRSDKIWMPEDEDKFLLNAPKRSHLPLLLGIYAGQRRGDLLKLPWSAYDGTYNTTYTEENGDGGHHTRGNQAEVGHRCHAQGQPNHAGE